MEVVQLIRLNVNFCIIDIGKWIYIVQNELNDKIYENLNGVDVFSILLFI